MQSERTRTAGRTIPPADLDVEVLTRVARGGLLICEGELRYQLARRGHDPTACVPGLLADLEQRGLIESAVHYRLTLAGAQLVPAAERPAPAAISSIPWTVPPTAATATSAPSGRSSARVPARPASRSPRTVRPRRKTEAVMT
jgi:hypothetical protein